MAKTILLIPAYQPEKTILKLLEALVCSRDLSDPDAARRHEAGKGRDPVLEAVFVVDDGSGEEYRDLFDAAQKLGCHVVRHEKNRGKGAAIRTGMHAAVGLYGPDVHIVTADADGQHLPADILRVAAVLQKENAAPGEPPGREKGLPQRKPSVQEEGLSRRKPPLQEEETLPQRKPPVLVLGVRDFSGKEVPFRSRWGNRITAAVFRLSTGRACIDTQTGLRGIPAALLPLALATEGDRYEYEMQFLLKAVRQADLRQVTIETVYEEGNRTSHFRPVRDSLLIYRRPLRFFLTAAASAVVDWILFLLLIRLFGSSAFSAYRVSVAEDAAAASALSRIGSGVVNFALNRKWSFQSKGRIGAEMVRYLVLFLANLFCNASAVAGLTLAGVPAALGKFMVDVVLFLVNYQVQKRWVFSK